jgi:hypothetical protein
MGFMQIFGISVAIFLWIRSILNFRRKKIPFAEFLLWSAIWGGMILIGVLPWTASFIANLLGVGRGVDVAIYLSIILLFYLAFLLFSRIDKQREEITRLVRELAIKKKK